MKKVLFLILFVPLCFYANARTWENIQSGVKATTSDNDIIIQFFNNDIVRIVKLPLGADLNKESLSVTKAPENLKLSVKENSGNLIIKSNSLLATLNLKTGNISFSSAGGSKLLAEKNMFFKDFNDAGNKTYTVSQSFVLDKDEAIYGLGIQQKGKMVQRNHKLRMIQGNTDDYIPFFHSVKGYGLFWDNYSPTDFSDSPDETSFKSDVGDCIDYYFIYGGNADGVIAGMRELTGDAPMFPLWTYGYWQSKERYKTQDETVDVVRKYRSLNVPLDGIIQDWQYWGNNYLWNATEFLNPGFNDPKKMIDDVHKMNAHIIISIWSSFGPETKLYKQFSKKGMLLDFITWPQSGSEKWPPNKDYPSGVRVYDAYNPEARDIYWKHLNEGIFSLGMDGWWMDSTEPDHLDFKPSDFDNKTYLGSFRKVRNAYPLMSVGGVYDNQRKVTSDKRVFILTRSAFAGQQRYAANTWSGDVTASWSALRNQISGGLNFSLCGIPYYNSDIGGFFLSRYRNKLEDPEYRELYVRWMQFGAFCPMMRSHGEGAPREIYQFGKKGEKIYDAIEKYIKLRYSFLPYIYSESWDVTKNRSSMMRALMMDFPNDKKALDIDDSYMFGKSVFVSPVTASVAKKDIYLPAGTSWVDFWTGEVVKGGQIVTKETPLEILPLYIKAGTILPIGPEVQYATEKRWDNLEIRIYGGANGKFVLYEDENDNYNYEKGIYSTINFSWDNKKNELTIGDIKGSFPGMLKERKFNIVFATDSKRAKTITYNGKKQVVKL